MPIKIKSASGSVTLSSENVSGDQTLTVPSQASATLQTTADTITSSRLTGALPAISGASLTSLTSGNLTGALPAISGASLTNLPAGGVAGITSTANATAITIDSAEQVGFSVTPKTWYSSFVAVQVGNAGAIAGRTQSNHMTVSANCYTSSSGDFKYINTDYASHYTMYNGKHLFNTAPSGTADAVITWTPAMEIKNSGRVTIGSATEVGWLNVDSGTVNTIAEFKSSDDNGFIVIKDNDTSGAISAQNGWISIGGAASALHANNLSINVSDGRGVSKFTAAVWCDWSGYTILKSHNVSSMVDNGSAEYAVNYSYALGSSNNAVVACSHKAGGNPSASNSAALSVAESNTSTSCLIEAFRADLTTRADKPVMVVVFGDP
jgi:hypothetical protein